MSYTVFSPSQMFVSNRHKYLTLISMLYLSCELASLVLSYKIVNYTIFFGAASSFIFPITYTWNDLITEVYGLKIALRTVFFVFVCDWFFILLITISIKAPSESATIQNSYDYVLGHLWRSLSSEMFGVLIGATANSFIMSKWKRITKGTGFWYRSIISSLIGEIIMLCISVPLALWGILNFHQIIKLMIYAFSYKLVFAVLISVPAGFLSSILKEKENISHFNFDESYNPFR
ncbi:queuosine precursor transporter [Legionella sp. W05-934-2]|uniref:queuosine precursor transporter n=1 Tax=Legionella sp. W05-934-2 TaxID=1198649 RepID=UPI003463161C